MPKTKKNERDEELAHAMQVEQSSQDVQPEDQEWHAEEHLSRLVVFHTQMEICIEHELCNEDVLHACFDTEAISFWKYFRGYARLRREEGYGANVDDLVVRFKGMSEE